MADDNFTSISSKKSDASSKEAISDSININNNYLQSQLLIAMPGIDDPYFKQSVTLICQHGSEGCFGLTINKPIEVTVDEVLNQLNLNEESSFQEDSEASIGDDKIRINTQQSSPALRGGPVQIEQGFVIHDSDKAWGNTLTIDKDLYVTASQEILVDIAAGKGPDNYLLTLGCASWEAGQIESEILDNSWLNCPVDKKIIFNMPFKDRWQGAADSLGINLSAMSSLSGHD